MMMYTTACASVYLSICLSVCLRASTYWTRTDRLPTDCQPTTYRLPTYLPTHSSSQWLEGSTGDWVDLKGHADIVFQTAAWFDWLNGETKDEEAHNADNDDDEVVSERVSERVSE
eukprot:GHVU01230977.1.p1 GENE.GHVU01230977.1~~GHVU01230977.1.p1  ORF type:complete len:115 (-),score=18.07 GHVU01230977.1:121-465(-)